MATIASPVTAALFKPLNTNLKLKHRIVLAPLTRCRAPGNVPSKAAIEYYRQRTTDGGLLISEGTVIDPTGHGYPQTPGLYTDEQVEAWKPITEAVHAKGGIIYAQIWHVGRASLEAYQPGGALPVAPSALSAGGVGVDPNTFQTAPKPVPRALETGEVREHAAKYARAAERAIEAGFDGVEIHGAHGYLIDEFLKSSSNKRTDEYGGSIENRARFAIEVVDAVAAAIGSDKVAIRLSPFSTFEGAVELEPYGLYAYLLEQLNKRDLAYVHMVEPRVDGVNSVENFGAKSLAPFRAVYTGTFVSAGGHTPETAALAVESGAADLVAFGRQFISNPDLVERLRIGAELSEYDRTTFYAPKPGKSLGIGYTDYPTLGADQLARLTLAPQIQA